MLIFRGVFLFWHLFQPKPRFSSNLQVAPAEAAPSAEVEAGWGSLWQRMVDEDDEEEEITSWGW